VGWLKHPVLTKRAKFNLTLEVGPGDFEGTWKIEKPIGQKGTASVTAFEGPFKVKPGGGPDCLLFRDADTVLNVTLNGAGPGTIAGRVIQCGLRWGGFFEARLDLG